MCGKQSGIGTVKTEYSLSHEYRCMASCKGKREREREREELTVEVCELLCVSGNGRSI
jgi:hypothetical protein